ncbi:MAG: choline/carnitine O-acyltransferase [Lautropia sp.]|nr:choline/carnitine O-acyltransferase [Lautropia sp.]
MPASPDLPHLPVSPLEDTCRRYLDQLEPLLSPEAFDRTRAVVDDFLSTEGSALHQALLAFGQQAGRQGKSWLIDTWLRGYLAGREPLPLASNVGFRLRSGGHSLADWISALAGVCADYRHGRILPPLSPRGEPGCMAQWAILRGASRIPRPHVDDYFIHPTGGRHIGLFHQGHYYRLAALDRHHEAEPAERVSAAIRRILGDDTGPNPWPVGVPSFLPREEAARVYARLGATPVNLRLLRHMAKDLFHVVIVDEALDEDTDLCRATFAPDQSFWCHKPITLHYNLATSRLHLHSEHTAQDGGMLQAAIRLAQQKLPATPVLRALTPSIPADIPTCTTSAPGPDLCRHDWQPDDGLKAQWPGWHRDYATRATRMRVRSLRIPFGQHAVPKGISHDALMQFLLQYAQLATWSKIRNTYEAVDVSHFQQGRTECVRPVSRESVAFVQAWLQHGLDAGQHGLFRAALDEHKARIRACKQGLGPNRQLLGLQQMADRQNLPTPALQADEGYRVFTTDFLSTSTIGDDSISPSIAFAPTSAGGLGINYTLTEAGWLFTISHLAGQTPDVQRFVQTLQEGGRALLAFVNGQFAQPFR